MFVLMLRQSGPLILPGVRPSRSSFHTEREGEGEGEQERLIGGKSPEDIEPQKSSLGG